MMRQVSSRSQRNKGLRVKNVLQLCLLAAVCFWLLYQLKHSYDKKRALEERKVKASEKIVESQLESLKLGRKDLSRSEENSSGKGIHDREEDNEEVEEEEEEEQDQEMKQAMEDEEAGGDGDDEIDEQDQERDDEQEDQGADEEAENGEELTNGEDKDSQGKETEPLDDQDPEEDSSHKAREESYKRDDVSSAVRRENQAENSENEEEMENTEVKFADADDMADGADDASKTNSDSSVGAADVAKDNATDVVLAGSKINWDDHPIMNGTVIEKQGSKFGLNNSEGSPSSNQRELHTNSTTESVKNNHVEAQANSISAVSNNQTETKTSSTASDAVADGMPLENGTLGRDSVQKHSVMVETENSEQNKINLKNVVMEGLAERFNTTVGQEDAGEHSSVSLGTRNNGDLIKGEFTESSHKMVTEEERDARIDLPTLPAMQNEARAWQMKLRSEDDFRM